MANVSGNGVGGIGNGEMVVGIPWAQHVPIFANVHAKWAHMLPFSIYSVGHSLRAAAIFLHAAECLHWQNGRSDRRNHHANSKTDKHLNS